MKRSNAFIVVGGIMPTNHPLEVFNLLKGINIVVRGDGEEVLPKIYEVLKEEKRDEIINQETIEKIKSLKGTYFKNNFHKVHPNDDSKNIVKNLDNSVLDFSIIKKEDIAQGLNLSSSRGCNNSCYFCSMPSKGIYRFKTAKNLKKILEDYKKRLIEIYSKEKNIPEEAFLLSFNDDDFLGDRERAIEFFNLIKQTRFKINFIQASIKSFFINKKDITTIDNELIDHMNEGVFAEPRFKDHYSIYLGTENFCDQELQRMGKGYNYKMVEKVIQELSRRKIKQGHHLILSNVYTSLDNIFENFYKIMILKKRYLKYFEILRPIIKNIVPFYKTPSYNKLIKNNNQKQIHYKEIINSKKYTYPIIEKEIPLDEEVKEIIKRIDFYMKKEKYCEVFFEKALLFLLNKRENLLINNNKDYKKIEKITKIIDKYSNYKKIIDNEIARNRFNNKKNNLQIMVTRRCQLRCLYCPIPKKDKDIDKATLRKSIDLLMSSKNKNLRLDFSGGETLLRPDLFKYGVMYALKKSIKEKKKIQFYLVTNALELNKDIIDFISNKNFVLEISIDGPREIHNKYKISLDNNYDVYKKTIKNVKKLTEKNINSIVVIVATPQSAKDLFNNFKHVINLGFKSIEINYSIGDMWNPKDKKVFFSEIKKIIDHYKIDIKKGKIEIGNLKKRIEPAVLNKEFMIDTDGRIRFLNEFLFKSKKKKKSPFNMKTVYDYDSFDKLYIDKFTVYYSLVKMFSENDSKIRTLLQNNIQMGLLSKKIFKKYKIETS